MPNIVVEINVTEKELPTGVSFEAYKGTLTSTTAETTYAATSAEPTLVFSGVDFGTYVLTIENKNVEGGTIFDPIQGEIQVAVQEPETVTFMAATGFSYLIQ
jgi:hypothetical protein